MFWVVVQIVLKESRHLCWSSGSNIQVQHSPGNSVERYVSWFDVFQTAEANNIDMDSQSKGGPSFIRGGNDCHTWHPPRKNLHRRQIRHFTESERDKRHSLNIEEQTRWLPTKYKLSSTFNRWLFMIVLQCLVLSSGSIFPSASAS